MLVMLGAVWLVPLVGLFVNSLRTEVDAERSGWWSGVLSPGSWTLENYRSALDTSNLGAAFLNSLVITVPSVVATLSVAAVAAYALSRFPVSGHRLMVGGIVVLIVIPLQTVLVPVLKLLNASNLTGTFVGIWLVHIGLGLPFGVYLLRTFFASLPQELFEAAALDGATPLTAFIRIALPVSRSALASVAIFQFIWIWNDLLIALIFLGGDPSVAPLTVSIANLVNTTTGRGSQTLAAGAFIAMSLPLGVFFSLQRYFVSGVLGGAVK